MERKQKTKKKKQNPFCQKTKEYLSLHSLYLSHYTRASPAPMCDPSHQ